MPSRAHKRKELKRLCRDRWSSLPEKLQTSGQLAGVAGVACGATHSVMEQCNFACTSCYLSDLANHTKPLPFAEVQAQLRQIREHVGPGGKVQVTSGEVTLLPVDELGRIIAYARHLDLDPMVMTNGERMLRDPDYLPRLVLRHGLRKICFHVDITQNGRRELRNGMCEADLHPVRDRCAELVRRTRRETGCELHAAHTVTVTPANLQDMPDIVRWATNNSDAIRMLSLLPVAEVGRTMDQRDENHGLDRLWSLVQSGLSRNVYREAMYFGHPDCNVTVPLVVVVNRHEARVVEIVREGSKLDRSCFSWLLRMLGPVVDLDDGILHNAGRAAVPLLLRPWRILQLLAWAAVRGVGEWRILARFGAGLLRCRGVQARPMMLVVHQFMNEQEMQTDLGRERLEACVFKLPVDGRMVSMCELNASGMRRDLNEAMLRERFESLATAR